MPLIMPMLRNVNRALKEPPVQGQGALWEDVPYAAAGETQGAFWPQPEGVLSTTPSQAPFYLKTERLFADPTSPLQPSASGQQYLNQLRKMPGIKAEELQYTGLAEWLPQQKNVTREQVLDFMAGYENRPQMERLTLGEPRGIPGGQDPYVQNLSLPEQFREQARFFENEASLYDPNSGSYSSNIRKARTSEIRAEAELADVQYGNLAGNSRSARAESLSAKASDLQEQANEAFQAGNESLYNQLTDESAAYARASREFESNTPAIYLGGRGGVLGEPDAAKYELYTELGGESYTEDLLQMPGLNGQYTHGHWSAVPDSGNYVAHTRQKIRSTPDGDQVTFAEEIQSDLHQAASARFKHEVDQRMLRMQEGGYLTGKVEELNQARIDAIEGNNEPLRRLAAQSLREEGDLGYRTPTRTTGRVPDAPFKGDAWRTLGFKNDLARAIEDGSDYVAITPAWMQQRRYHGERDQAAGTGAGWDTEDLYIDAHVRVDSDGDIFVSIYDGTEGHVVYDSYFSDVEDVTREFGTHSGVTRAAENVEAALENAPVWVVERDRTAYRVVDENGDEREIFEGVDELDDLDDLRQQADEAVLEGDLDEEGAALWAVEEEHSTDWEVSTEDGDYDVFDSIDDAEERARELRVEYLSNSEPEYASMGAGEMDVVDEYVRENYGAGSADMAERAGGDFEVPYEKVLPGTINKYLKQLGRETKERYSLERIEVDMESDVTGKAGPEEVWALRITPRLRAHIQGTPGDPLTGGQSMFSVGAGVGTVGALQPQQPSETGALQAPDGGGGLLDTIQQEVGGFMDQYSTENVAPPGQRSFVEGGMNDLVSIAAGLENALALGAQGVNGVMAALEILSGALVNRDQNTEEVLSRWQGYSYNPRSTQAERQQEILLDLIRDNPKLRDTLEYLGEVAPRVERSILETTKSRPLSHAGRAVLETM